MLRFRGVRCAVMRVVWSSSGFLLFVFVGSSCGKGGILERSKERRKER
jgi:hypothetical protein